MTSARKPGEHRPDLIIDPLDYLILDELPIEGTLHFGAYPVGKTAANIQKVVGAGQVRPAERHRRTSRKMWPHSLPRPAPKNRSPRTTPSSPRR